MSQGLTLASVAAVAGLVGFGVGAGMWSGRIEQILVDHDRRLTVDAASIRDINMTAGKTETRLARIEEQLSFLVRSATAAERRR